MIRGVRPDLPSGEVTLLFTDVEGSTRLLHEVGPERYAMALDAHRGLIRKAFAAYGGVEVDTQGDAFFVAFSSAGDAVAAAVAAQAALAETPVSVRMGLHTGTPHLTGDGYVGEDVHLGARIGAAGHGGQVLLSATTRARVDVEVLDLGEHRLKDFSEPASIFQLGREHFPPLKTISNTNLPRPPSSFIGREDEVSAVAALLNGDSRLVTLTGAGGSGKTRLGIEAAAALVPSFKAGVFWVGLATVREAQLVLDAVAQTLGAKEDLASHIGERDMLLLLDNFEQVIEAAADLSRLLQACPNLRLLVTSRELLRIQGEEEYPVLPLAEPDAVALFVQRARIEPDEIVAELCGRLDNLPLAVELAAARVRVLSPQQILERISQRLDLLQAGRDADPRQQTLRATIGWSYDLLAADEQQLFAQLGVFAGGCTLAAAEKVVDAEIDVLQSLVEKSLVRRTTGRFWMLETIREYAALRLDASHEAESIRRRHADYLLDFAEQAWPHAREQRREWLDRLEAEQPNFRSALDWLESSDTQSLLRLCGALGPLWANRGQQVEGRARLERALATDSTPTEARARALIPAAGLALDAGDTDVGRAHAEEALELYNRFRDDWGVARATGMLGFNFVLEAKWNLARSRFEQAAELFRKAGDIHFTIEMMRRVAWMYEELGDPERARRMHQANYEAARDVGREHLAATSLAVLAGFALDGNEPEVALPMLVECLDIHLRADDRYQALLDIHRFARAYAQLGAHDTAAQLLAACEALHEELAFRMEPWVVDQQRDVRMKVVADGTDIEVALEGGKRLSLEDAAALAMTFARIRDVDVLSKETRSTSQSSWALDQR